LIVVSGVAGTLAGTLPWPVATLPGFDQHDATTPEHLPMLVERALADAGRAPSEFAWKDAGFYLAGAGARACALAQRWDWCGPTLGLDAECAGGLAALLLAAQDLEAGRCSLAVVAAEQIVDAGDGWDDRCAPLAAAAHEGGARAGAAVLVLERAGDARRLRGQLLGGAHRRLGAPAGMVALSLRGIAEVLQLGLERSRLEPSAVGYVELHALGGALGDAIELSALGRVWKDRGDPDRPTKLGSHKAGFGHLEAPAGLVGIARVLAWLASGELPPTAWRPPFTSLSKLPKSLMLSEPGPEPVRAGGCLALARSGVGAVVFVGPPPSKAP
jgi:acyl transferase domain-containing protein